VLLESSSSTGSFSQVASGATIVGDTVQFTVDVSAVDDTYYTTLGDTNPLAADVSSFTAEVIPGGSGDVLLSWETASEVDNDGFNVYRATVEDGPYSLLGFEPPKNPGSGTGASYTYTDTTTSLDTTYYYKLEDLDTSGKTTMHGPVSVGIGPNAVGLSGFGAAPVALPAAMLALAGAALLLKRRKR
jgi:hypothetical protein